MVKTETEAKNKGGRPRSKASRDAILLAAFSLLVRDGYQSLSIEGVAREAGVGKSTIYRWWHGRADLVIDAFFAVMDEQPVELDTGTARGDFLIQIVQMGEELRGPRGRAFAAMLAGAQEDPTLGVAVRKRWLDPRRDWARARLARAAQDGELQDGIDSRAALALLYSPLYSPLLFGNTIPPEKDLEACVDLAAKAIFR